MKALEVNDLHKSYLRAKVLRGISFSVEAGEFFGFAGANGTGKSTFLKCMLDFCHYERGDIKIFGVSCKDRHARARIAFLPERFIPPYYLTGEEFLRLIMKLQGAVYRREDAEVMFEQLNLHESAFVKPVRSFSKGMTQKLGLLGCFMAKRDFYFLDEPMSGLDPKARALVKKQFNILRERGATLFFTSHALADIEEVCSRMAILHDGELRHLDSPAALRQAYPTAATLEEAYLQLIDGGGGGARAAA